MCGPNSCLTCHEKGKVISELIVRLDELRAQNAELAEAIENYTIKALDPWENITNEVSIGTCRIIDSPHECMIISLDWKGSRIAYLWQDGWNITSTFASEYAIKIEWENSALQVLVKKR